MEKKSITVAFQTNDRGTPPGKLAEAEVRFHDGPLAGLKLVGFSVWERRGGGAAGLNVTFPARQYSVNGERRSFALLRPAHPDNTTDEIRLFILQEYDRFVQHEEDGIDDTREAQVASTPNRSDLPF